MARLSRSIHCMNKPYVNKPRMNVPRLPRAIMPLVLAIACFAVVFGAKPAYADKCGSLTALKFTNTKITSAETVPAGASSLSPGNISLSLKGLPAFCRVTAEIHPAKDSDIKIEVWMPISGWNGKFLGQGNGGFAGRIAYDRLQQGILRGYATASTDTGHTGEVRDADWALGHPQKIIDFGYRAIHEMTVKAKRIVHAFYAKAPQYSYFASCSNGGRQALMEAQRFPGDYIGILAGAPANNWTHAMAGFMSNTQALSATPASRIPPSKLPAINSAALKTCDARDGVKDGIITDPSTCRFDPAVLLCKGADSDACLTAPQIEALKKVYSGVKDSHGKLIYPGYLPGDELGPGGWSNWITAPTIESSGQYMIGSHYYANMVFDDPKWDYRTFQVDRDVKFADARMAGILNSTNPDLKPFADRGGKLILYHGWGDASLTPLNTINYYDSVVAAMPGRSGSFLRLYMVPGMQHCGGGLGAVDFGQYNFQYDPEHNIFSNLERWVQSGAAPSRIVAWQHKDPDDLSTEVIMTRPICPYPQEAHYKGNGDTKDAANFVCKEVEAAATIPTVGR